MGPDYRPMSDSPQSPMLTVLEARAAVLAGICPATDTETVPLAGATGRYLAQAVASASAHPAFDNSSMDGYALDARDAPTGASLPVEGESRCGALPGPLAAHKAMRIFTGAPLPAGANAVAPQETVERTGNTIRLLEGVREGQHVRHAGEDIARAQILFERGQRLRFWDLPALAAAGVDRVTVWTRPRVLVFATGDELVEPGAPRAKGQVYESNRLATLAALSALGADVVDGGIVADRLAIIEETLASAHAFDFVIASGGASVGDYDLVRQALQAFGEIRFWRARVKPGKPLAFGRLHERGHFFSLPGNPVSSLVTFKIFVEPAVVAWSHGTASAAEVPATALHDYSRAPGRTEYLRARLHWGAGGLRVELTGGQGSHEVGPLTRTNALLRLDESTAGFAKGETVAVLPLSLGEGF